MFRWGLLFVTVTSLELFLLLHLGAYMGIWWTAGLILFTGFLGAHLTRMQGIRTVMSMQKTMQEGRMPHREMIDGVCILIAGAFLLTPGILTDITGFLLLTPAFRAVLYRYIEKRVQRFIQENTHTIVIEQ